MPLAATSLRPCAPASRNCFHGPPSGFSSDCASSEYLYALAMLEIWLIAGRSFITCSVVSSEALAVFVSQSPNVASSL